MAEVCEIYGAAVTDTLITWDEQAPSRAIVAEKFAELTAARYPFLVAAPITTRRDEPGILGYASTGPFHPQSGFRYTAENSIYVRPEHRRTGIGRQLLTTLLAELKSAGFRTVIAGVSNPGAEASLAFHKAMGFIEAGRLPNAGYKMGQWLEAIYLTRDLGEPDDMDKRR